MPDQKPADLNPKTTVFRLQGIPVGVTEADLGDAILEPCPKSELEALEEPVTIDITMCMSCYGGGTQTALAKFSYIPAYLSQANGEYQLLVDGEVVNIDIDFYDFTPLYPTRPGVEIKADIVAVTELSGHAFRSWRGRGALQLMWLQDFLAKDFPDCRTVTYGYNSKLDDKTGTHMTMDYARHFLTELEKIRARNITRPIVFICHGFGGIVVIESLLRAKDQIDPALKALFPATYATIFFATPQRGIEVKDMLAYVGEESSRAALLRSISTDAELLVAGYERFFNEASNQKLRVLSFYEQHKRKLLEKDAKTGEFRRTSAETTVLDSRGSSLNLPDAMERKVPVDKDHSEITKFESKNDTTYTTVVEFLKVFRSEDEGIANMHNCATAKCAIEHNNMRVLRVMCSKKRVDVDAVQKDGTTLLHMAASHGIEEAIELLLYQGAKIEAVDKNKNTSLLLAAKNGHERAVTCLLEHHADTEAKNKDGETALFLAAQGSHEGAVKALLVKGADKDTALLLAATLKDEVVADLLLKYEGGGIKALRLVAQDDDEELVEFLLEHKADGGTALFLAVKDNDEDVIKRLLEYEADKDKALFCAAKDRNGSVMDWLVEKGADITQAMLLACAAKGVGKPVVKLLLDKGADIDEVNENSETALFLAAQRSSKPIAKFLVGQGADLHKAIQIAAETGDQEALSLLNAI